METMSKYFSKEDLQRKKSEDWARKKAEEWAKANSDLTFVEWCYKQGKAEARETNDCPYIVDKKCDIAKCEEFHIRADERAKTIELYTKFCKKSHSNFDEEYAEDIRSDFEEWLKEQK